MNNISQISVFDYSEIEILGDLERLKLFFENSDDKELCESLDNERKNLIPPARVFSVFLNKLKKYKNIFKKINEELVQFMYDNLENFGKDCAVDGKYLDTYANQFHKSKAKKQMIIERNMMQRHLVKHIT